MLALFNNFYPSVVICYFLFWWKQLKHLLIHAVLNISLLNSIMSYYKIRNHFSADYLFASDGHWQAHFYAPASLRE
jgi:hypothetical protein